MKLGRRLRDSESMTSVGPRRQTQLAFSGLNLDGNKFLQLESRTSRLRAASDDLSASRETTVIDAISTNLRSRTGGASPPPMTGASPVHQGPERTLSENGNAFAVGDSR